MRLTPASIVLSLATLILTAGCGSSGPSTPTVISLGTTTPNGLAPNTNTAGTTPTPGSRVSQNVVGTVGFSFSTGDKVELTFAVDPMTDLASADLMAQSCGLDSDPSRALIDHVRVTATLTSSLAQKFTLNFGNPMLVPLAAQFASGGQCLPPGYDSGITLSLNPGQSNTQDLWMIGDGAKSPTYPAGDPKILGWMTFDPAMHLASDTFGVGGLIEYAYGSRVLVCKLDTVRTVEAEVFADTASFAKGDSHCAPAATRDEFEALEREAGTVQ